MAFSLSTGIQLRKESWGLLFYSQDQHRLFFLKSRDWLFPFHFDGTWSLKKVIDDVSQRTGISVEQISRDLRRTIGRLEEKGLIINELS